MEEKEAKNPTQIVLNEKSMEVFITKFIPTSQYFERSFEMLRNQIEKQNEEFKEFRKDVDRRFKQVDSVILEFKKDVDRRFDEVNKKFEQVDKRFEQVDKRFEQIDKKIENLSQNIQDLTLEIKELTKSQEITLREYIIERDRHYDQKFATNRTYFLTVMGLMLTIFLKMVGIIDLPHFDSTTSVPQVKIEHK